MTVFFTADTHFGHAGALRLYRRPFASVAEMDAAMIERWNAVVGDSDEIWHLGDFSKHLALADVAERLSRLRGRKHLITGNNDPPAVAALPDWASVQTYAEILVEDTRLVLCHYAFRTWNGMGKGALDLHGHSHGRLKPQTRQVDVGVDVWDFRPVTVGEIQGRRRKKQFAECGSHRRSLLAD
jgi:calcineurin-like phosphoesterase family protein